MTENLLQKLEEKMMTLLSEVEDLRNEVARLNHENTTLKFERETHAEKLRGLISLIETINPADNVTALHAHNKPILVQADR